jgi:hypothetical protein
MTGKKAKDTRDELVEAMKKKEVHINVDSAEPSSGKFSLAHIGWRGPIHVRSGWSRQEWHLFLESGGKVMDVIMDQDILHNTSVPATIGKPKPTSVLALEGELPQRSALNPDKKTKAIMEILDSGTYKTVETEPGRIVLEIKGKDLKGKYVLEQEGKTGTLWVLKRNK